MELDKSLTAIQDYFVNRLCRLFRDELQLCEIALQASPDQMSYILFLKQCKGLIMNSQMYLDCVLTQCE